MASLTCLAARWVSQGSSDLSSVASPVRYQDFLAVTCSKKANASTRVLIKPLLEQVVKPRHMAKPRIELEVAQGCDTGREASPTPTNRRFPCNTAGSSDLQGQGSGIHDIPLNVSCSELAQKRSYRHQCTQVYLTGGGPWG